ncbi:MAG: hypothetical protein ACRDIX_08810 [Actinomycetota bacterium]
MMTKDRVALVVEDCVEYWRKTGVPRSGVAGMREELERHLRDAVTEGKSAESVVGPDVLAFAEEWAQEYRGPGVMLRAVDGTGPAFLALATGVLLLLSIGTLGAYVGGGAIEVCCPRTVVETGPSLEPSALLWIGFTTAVALLSLVGAVALFRKRLRLGGGVLLVATPLALLTPMHVFAAGMLLGAAAWAFARARRAEPSAAAR